MKKLISIIFVLALTGCEVGGSTSGLKSLATCGIPEMLPVIQIPDAVLDHDRIVFTKEGELISLPAQWCVMEYMKK